MLAGSGGRRGNGANLTTRLDGVELVTLLLSLADPGIILF